MIVVISIHIAVLAIPTVREVVVCPDRWMGEFYDSVVAVIGSIVVRV